MTKSVGLVLWE